MKNFYLNLLIKLLGCLSLFYLLAACGNTRNLTRHPTTQATLWVQNSAGYKAITRQIYQTAASNLTYAVNDSLWSAALEQDKNFQHLPPALIFDVDETVLDNSAFQARMIKQNLEFDTGLWNSWVLEARADAVPGALSLIKQAEELGITVFYLTNREAYVESGTRENLENLGSPLPRVQDVILSNRERSSWTSEKVNRRKFVARNYRILMMFGDDLNDFIPAKNISPAARDSLIYKHWKNWGQMWYILPNPVYGSWEQAMFDFNNSLQANEKEVIILKNLNTKN